jgi:23S rRNA (pseudouridine1915-N3)-methyltransferase
VFFYGIPGRARVESFAKMKIWLGSIHPARGRGKGGLDAVGSEYMQRIAHYEEVEAVRFTGENELFAWADRRQGRAPLYSILLDSRGTLSTSEQFAARLGQLRDQGRQHVLFGIGPADGWSQAARTRADALLSLGAITLPHELAGVVLAEQVYRALTILAGHPYHSGH